MPRRALLLAALAGCVAALNVRVGERPPAKPARMGPSEVNNASLHAIKTSLTTTNWTTAASAGAPSKADVAAARAAVLQPPLPSPPAWFAAQTTPGDMTCYVDPASGRVTGLAQGGQTVGYATAVGVTVPLANGVLVDVEVVLVAPTTVGSFVFWVAPDGGKGGAAAPPILCGAKAATPFNSFAAVGAKGRAAGARVATLAATFKPPTALGRRRRLAQVVVGGGADVRSVAVGAVDAPGPGGAPYAAAGGGAFALVPPALLPLDGPCTAHIYPGPSTAGTVACQNCLNQPVNGMSQVTAANFANVPTYNAQCGQCLQVFNSDDPAAPSLFFTVIDFKGDQGLDLNLDYAYSQWNNLYVQGKINCRWQFVDASNCPWRPA